jgi:cytochrome c oxidase cbb3-type subunit I/II
MYWAGFSQSLMWKQFTESGQLQFQFMETVTHIVPMYIIRGIGGTLYWIGAIMAVYNIYKTMKQGQFVEIESGEAMPLSQAYACTKFSLAYNHREKTIAFLIICFHCSSYWWYGSN